VSVHAARGSSLSVAHVSRAATAAANWASERRWAARWQTGQVPTWRVCPQCSGCGWAVGSLPSGVTVGMIMWASGVRGYAVSTGSCRCRLGLLTYKTSSGPQSFHASSRPTVSAILATRSQSGDRIRSQRPPKDWGRRDRCCSRSPSRDQRSPASPPALLREPMARAQPCQRSASNHRNVIPRSDPGLQLLSAGRSEKLAHHPGHNWR
jgi:hypothetical protein